MTQTLEQLEIELRNQGLSESQIQLLINKRLKEEKQKLEQQMKEQEERNAALEREIASRAATPAVQVAGNLQDVFDRTWDVVSGRMKDDLSNLNDQVVTSSAAEIITDAADGLVTSTALEIISSAMETEQDGNYLLTKSGSNITFSRVIENTFVGVKKNPTSGQPDIETTVKFLTKVV